MKRRSLGNWARTGSALLLSLGIGGVFASACTPTSRDFSTSSGGTTNVCEPNTSEACYSGTPGTEDIGVCHPGTHTCLSDGTGWGPCEGEVVPTTEICTTPIDEGCDGPNPVECPSLDHVWSKNFGGAGEDAFTAIAIDPATGDIVATGYFTDDTIDFGGGPMASTGRADIFLARFTADGQHIWSKRFGDAEDQFPKDIAIDAKGAIYIVGEAYGAVDFGDGKPLTSKGAQDAFIAKFDSTGKGIWSRFFGDAQSQRATSVAITPTNQVILGGNFSGFIQLTSMELPSLNSTDAFVIKLDESGFDIGAKHYGSPSDDELLDLQIDSTGGIVISGSYSDTMDFGSLGTFPCAGSYDAFVLKLKADLTEEYARVYGDASSQRGYAIAIAPNDDVFVQGGFSGMINLGDGTMLTALDQSSSVFFIALAADGSLRWGKSADSGQVLFDRQALVVDPSTKSIVSVGYFAGTIDLGGGPQMAQFIDGFIAKFGWDGSYISSRTLGGASIDAFFGLAVSPTGDVFVAGGHQGPADFGDGVLDTPAGPQDVQAMIMRRLP